MVWRNHISDDSKEKKERAGYIGMMILSAAIMGIDSIKNGDPVSFAGAGGVLMLSSWGLMNLRRDKTPSAFDEKE